MKRIEQENVIYITPTGLSVRTSGPVVYLDNWAYIELAEKNSDLRRRFLDVIHAGADLLFSVANVAQLSGSRGRSADAIRDFLDAIGPRWFPAHMNATEVVKRESEGVPHDKACKDEYFFKTYVADQMRPFIVRGELVPLSDHLFRLGAIVDRVAGQRDSISSTSDAFDEVLRTKMTTAHDRCKRDPGLLDRKFPLLPYIPDRPATFVYYNLLRVMAVDAGSLKRGDGLDFCHATIACAFSNFAALGTRWKARVSMLPKPNRIARVYSPAEFDQMIAEMELWLSNRAAP